MGDESFLDNSLTSDAILRAVFDFLDELFLVFDGDGRLREWNWALPEVTAFTDDELASMSAGDLFADAHAERVEAAVAEVLETGYAAVDATLRTGTGEGIPCEFRMSRFPLDDLEPGVVVVGYNVTARKEREAKLERLRERSLALMATQTEAETAQVAADAAHSILEASLSEVYLAGETGDALEAVATATGDSKPLDTVPRPGPDADSGTRSALLWDAFETGQVRRIEDARRSDALTEESPVRSVIVHPLADHGALVVSDPEPGAFDETDDAFVEILATALIAALDRVDRERRLRERERQLERENERLDEFVSVVSHDLRNPLNVANGRLELARKHCDSEHLDDVAGAHERMEQLIDDLLTLARAGDRIRDIDPLDIAATARDCWANVETGEASLVTEAEQTIMADGSRFRQLLENLVRNVIEHAGDEVTITVGELDDGFYVADDGPGIPPDEREGVFESGYSTSGDGAGFGLAIVQSIANAHDWEIAVTDSDTGGARFEVTGVETAAG